MQIESKCTVRKEAPTPQKGDLPLPAGLEQKLQFQPNTVEDLNVVVPEGAAQLSTPQYDQNVSCGADEHAEPLPAPAWLLAARGQQLQPCAAQNLLIVCSTEHACLGPSKTLPLLAPVQRLLTL